MGKTALLYILIVFALLVSAVNINSYLGPNKVLGAEIEESVNNEAFWNEFLANNPDYIPGWIEIGRMDKVLEIDPNYFIQP